MLFSYSEFIRFTSMCPYLNKSVAVAAVNLIKEINANCNMNMFTGNCKETSCCQYRINWYGE